METAAYGLLIEVTDPDDLFTKLSKADVDKKADVCVRLNGVAKEFTFDEFKERLGF